MGSWMLHYLGRKTSHEVLQDVDRWMLHSWITSLEWNFMFCYHQVTKPTFSRTWHKSLIMFLSASVVQTDGFLTCPSRCLKCTQSFLECCLAIGHFCRAHCASNKSIPSHTAPPFFWQSTLHQCDSGSFFHSADGALCQSVRCWAMMGCLCHDSVADLDKLWWTLLNCLCKLCLASVKEEEISVSTTLSPMFLPFKRMSATPLRETILHDLLCPHLDSFSVFKMLWSAVINSPKFAESAIPSTRFWGFILHLARVVCVLLQTSQWDLSDNECAFSLWFPLGWEPMIPFATLGFLCHSISSTASGTTEGGLSSRRFSAVTCLGPHPAFGVEEGAWSSFNPSVSGSNRSNWRPSLLFLAQSFLWRTRIPWMVELFVW